MGFDNGMLSNHGYFWCLRPTRRTAGDGTETMSSGSGTDIGRADIVRMVPKRKSPNNPSMSGPAEGFGNKITAKIIDGLRRQP